MIDCCQTSIMRTAGHFAGLLHAAGGQARSSEQRAGGSTPAGLPTAEGGRAADAERGLQFRHCWGHARRPGEPADMGGSVVRLHVGLRSSSRCSRKQYTVVPAFRWQLAVATLGHTWRHCRPSIARHSRKALAQAVALCALSGS